MRGAPWWDEVDAFLNNAGLRRVETNWAGGSWGDGLYVELRLKPDPHAGTMPS